MSLRGDNPSRYSRYHLKRDHAGVSLASSSKSSSLKRASLLSGLLFVFILPSVLNIEHRARKHHHYSSSSEYSRGGANGNSNNNNVRLRFKTREENHRENDRLQHEWWRDAQEGLGKVWHKVFDEEEDESLTNTDVYKPEKFGHQVAKKTHERVVGNTDENARNDGGGEFNLDKAIAEEMSKDDDDDEDHMEGTTWKGGVPVVKGHKTCEYCSNKGACLTETTCQCPAIYEGERCEKLRDFVDHPRVMKGFKKGFEGASLLAKANTKNNMPLMVRRNPGQPAHPGTEKAMVTEIGKLTRPSRDKLPEEDPLGSVVFETCAIVGSSGILLKHSHGADIDSHDVVFRFNSATTKGFEKNVGAKTTHRITNSRNYGFREYDSECVVQHMRNEMSLVKMFKKRAKYPGLNLYGVHPQLHGWVDKSFSFLVTSGLFGALIAAHKCASVDLYGFQVSRHHGVQYHYYNAVDEPANEERDGDEWLAVKSLVESGVLHFADPCIIECHESARACLNCQEEHGDDVHLSHHAGGAGGDSYSSSSSSNGATTTNNAHGNRGRRGGAKHAVKKSHSSHDFQSEFRSGSSDSDSDKTEDDDDQVSQSSSSDEFTH